MTILTRWRRALASWLASDSAALEREVAMRVLFEDRCRTLTAEIDGLKSELVEARRDTTHSVKLVADWFSQQMFGRRIYMSAPELAEQPAAPELIAKPRQQGRALCEQLEREFYESLQSKEEVQ